MISLKEAQASAFTNSTKKELLEYAKELGIENIAENAPAAVIRRAVCSALGIAIDSEGRAAPQPQVSAARGGDRILPPYNLTPNGIWGGRRHRMSIPRPEGTKIGQAEGYAWNGKHEYYIAYDEVDSVPEPIYNIIVTNRRRRVSAVRPQGGEVGELTTKWDFDPVSLNYIGVDEETKDRAGSLLEWYQGRGSKWFHDLTARQLTQVARMLEVPTQQYMGQNIPPRIFSHEEVLERVMEFLYGYADADVAPNEKLIAADEAFIAERQAKTAAAA